MIGHIHTLYILCMLSIYIKNILYVYSDWYHFTSFIHDASRVNDIFTMTQNAPQDARLKSLDYEELRRSPTLVASSCQ